MTNQVSLLYFISKSWTWFWVLRRCTKHRAKTLCSKWFCWEHRSYRFSRFRFERSQRNCISSDRTFSFISSFTAIGTWGGDHKRISLRQIGTNWPTSNMGGSVRLVKVIILGKKHLHDKILSIFFPSALSFTLQQKSH